jgi:hypothetical protein
MIQVACSDRGRIMYTNRLASATGMLPNPEYHGLAR